MLIRKLECSGPATWNAGSFNPSYSGCWFGRWRHFRWSVHRAGFQSFLFWMLIRKFILPADCREILGVSILLILDVDSEAPKKVDHHNCCFFVSILLILDVDSEEYRKYRVITFCHYVSILLILDVDSEEVLSWLFPEIAGSFNPSYSGCWFGSHATLKNTSCQDDVSILLILDVDSEAW
mgnify:CR=1 FL=1